MPAPSTLAEASPPLGQPIVAGLPMPAFRRIGVTPISGACAKATRSAGEMLFEALVIYQVRSGARRAIGGNGVDDKAR